MVKQTQATLNSLPLSGSTADDPRFNFETFDSLRAMVRHPLAGHTDYIHRLALFLPEIAANIDESDFWILHLEMGVLTQATRTAIARADFATAHRHFAFISNLLEFANAELRDAIRVSYLENLLLGETSQNHQETRRLLPELLETELRKLEAHFQI